MGAVGHRGKYKRIVGEFSEGVLETVTDAVLFSVFVTIESSSHHVVSAFYQADQDLKKFNFQVIKRALSVLKTKGYINPKGEITALGKGRIEKLVPEIFAPVPRLSGELFLIIYDLDNSSRIVRNTLPKFLKKRHCIMISKSVYLSVADPSQALNEFLSHWSFRAQIIVAKMGAGSLIGGTNMRDYLTKLFDLDDLNKEYFEFVRRFENAGKSPAVFYRFAQIARRDPNLPKEFLPDNWAGCQARNIISYSCIHGTRDKKLLEKVG